MIERTAQRSWEWPEPFLFSVEERKRRYSLYVVFPRRSFKCEDEKDRESYLPVIPREVLSSFPRVPNVVVYVHYNACMHAHGYCSSSYLYYSPTSSVVTKRGEGRWLDVLYLVADELRKVTTQESPERKRKSSRTRSFSLSLLWSPSGVRTPEKDPPMGWLIN